jgi:hypothetical protein
MSRYAQLSKPSLKSDATSILAFAEKTEEVAEQPAAAAVVRKTRGQAAPLHMKRLTINLPEELHKLLRLKSIQQGTTATDIIIGLLKEELR